MDRRPIKTRDATWVHKLAGRLTAWGISPNQVSVASVVFALVGAGGMLQGWWWLAAIGIQLRLLCNLLDGLMAVEGGAADPVGALYNDVPDRLADGALFVAAGHAVGVPELGWAAAFVAVLVAYQRFVGASLLGSHDFGGPMSKSHRMFALTCGCVAMLIPGVGVVPMVVVLWLVVVGGALTFALRLRRAAAGLKEAA